LKVEIKWILRKWFCGENEDESLSTPEAGFFLGF
jgi:hypothetical protein